MTTWWQFMNQLKPILCKHYGTYRVYYAYVTVWAFLYLWIYLFCFFSPNLCCVPRLYIALFSVAIVALGFGGDIETIGDIFYWTYRGTIFYCTIPRQLILHLHRYNILRSPRGTQFWVSRSKKCLVRKWQYLVFFRYFLTTYIIPFFNADVLKKYYKKRLFVSLFLFSF